MAEQRDDLIARRFEVLERMEVPDTWERILATADVDPAPTRFRRSALGVAAAGLLLVGAAVVWVVTRGDPSVSVATPTVDPTLEATAVASVSTVRPPSASILESAVPPMSAIVSPATVSPGDVVTITPSRAVEATCNEGGVLRAIDVGFPIVAQLEADGSWNPGPDVTWLSCAPAPAADSLSYVTPNVAAGTYLLCVTQDVVSEGCATLTITQPMAAPPTAPTTASMATAIVEPSTVAPDDPITITPSTPVSGVCGGGAVLRQTDAASTPVGQLGPDRWWDPGPALESRSCLPAPSDDAVSFVTPDVAAGTYLLCVTPDVVDAGCGLVTVIERTTRRSPGVSYRSMPPALPIRELATVPLTPRDGGERGVDVAIGDLGVVVNQQPRRAVTVVDNAGGLRDVGVDGDLGQLVYGPGDVVYGTRGGATIQEFAMVAVALSGDRAGTTVASAPVDINHYVELPIGSVGHGTDGIVNRDRNPSATVLPYVDVNGQPTTLAAEVPPLLTTLHSTDTDDVTVSTGDGRYWRFTIDAAPDRASPFLGPSPAAPGPDGTIVYWTHIGPNARPDLDFGEPTMWVLAVLGTDGAIDWYSIPDGWNVVASDVWGTVLGRITGGQLELALADVSPPR